MENGQKIPIKYEVWIVDKPSNLGRGKVYYFICPFKGKRCKVLYMGYGSRYFKSREAYSHRIYYYSQLSSRLDKHNDKYWRLARQLETLHKKHPKSHYQGKETRARKRIQNLEEKQFYHDQMRWRIFPIKLARALNRTLGTDISSLF